jgi:hypothetical protein
MSSCCAILASVLALLAPLLSPLLLLTCFCWGGGFSYFFLSGVGGVSDEYSGEIGGEAAVQDLLNHLVHVNDTVVNGRSVFLLLAEAKPALDTNFEGIKNFCWVLEIPCNPDFDG